jgi:stress-induced morphogen
MFRVRDTRLSNYFLTRLIYAGGCGSFYAITIASQAFNGLPIVKQHKLVTQTLQQEIEGIHGLQARSMKFSFSESLLKSPLDKDYCTIDCNLDFYKPRTSFRQPRRCC